MKIQKDPKNKGEYFLSGFKINKTKRRKTEGKSINNIEGKTQVQFNCHYGPNYAKRQYFLNLCKLKTKQNVQGLVCQGYFYFLGWESSLTNSMKIKYKEKSHNSSSISTLKYFS